LFANQGESLRAQSVTDGHFLLPGRARATSRLATLRQPISATGSWSAPVSISGPNNYISPEATAVESSGNAIAIYSGYDASSVHTEYATSYQP